MDIQKLANGGIKMCYLKEERERNRAKKATDKSAIKMQFHCFPTHTEIHTSQMQQEKEPSPFSVHFSHITNRKCNQMIVAAVCRATQRNTQRSQFQIKRNKNAVRDINGFYVILRGNKSDLNPSL